MTSYLKNDDLLVKTKIDVMYFFGVLTRHKDDGTLHMPHIGLIRSILKYLGLNGMPKTEHIPVQKIIYPEIRMIKDIKRHKMEILTYYWKDALSSQ